MNARKWVDAIAHELGVADPGNRKKYEANARNLKVRIEGLHKELAHPQAREGCSLHRLSRCVSIYGKALRTDPHRFGNAVAREKAGYGAPGRDSQEDQGPEVDLRVHRAAVPAQAGADRHGGHGREDRRAGFSGQRAFPPGRMPISPSCARWRNRSRRVFRGNNSEAAPSRRIWSDPPRFPAYPREPAGMRGSCNESACVLISYLRRRIRNGIRKNKYS